MIVDVSFAISDRLRQQAEQGDAATWNLLGAYSLRCAPPHLNSLPFPELGTADLESRIQGLDYGVNDEFETMLRTDRDVGLWSDMMSTAGPRLAMVRLAIRARQSPEQDHLAEWNASRQRELRQAFDCFRQAAMLGDPEGFWNLGWRYYLGEGVEASEMAAICCWQSAVRGGHVKAAERLQEILPDGVHFMLLGIARDLQAGSMRDSLPAPS